MSLSERDRSRLEEMCDLLEEIQKDRLAIKNNKEFSDRSLVARAIAFDFEQLGEIAGRMSEEFLFAHPNFPLRYMKGFRNILVHDYAHLDLKVLETTLYGDVDNLLDLIKAYLAEK